MMIIPSEASRVQVEAKPLEKLFASLLFRKMQEFFRISGKA